MRDIVADAQNRFYDLERSGANPLTGVWRKDRKASDCMDEACEMVALPWIFRKALLILNTLQIEDTQSYFKTTMKAGGLMDVVEKVRILLERQMHCVSVRATTCMSLPRCSFGWQTRHCLII